MLRNTSPGRWPSRGRRERPWRQAGPPRDWRMRRQSPASGSARGLTESRVSPRPRCSLTSPREPFFFSPLFEVVVTIGLFLSFFRPSFGFDLIRVCRCRCVCVWCACLAMWVLYLFTYVMVRPHGRKRCRWSPLSLFLVIVPVAGRLLLIDARLQL